MAYIDDVQQLYQQQLGREADASGLAYYTQALQNGLSVQDVVNMMQASPEAQGLLGGGGGGAPQQSPAQQPPSWYTTPPAWMQQQPQQGPNPYLPQITEAMQQQNQLALQNGLNSIRSNSVGVGGLGGSRQGVAEGVATGLAAQGLAGNLANLYGQSWNNDQNRALQRYGIDTNASLGWGGLENQRYGMDQNFWTAERSGDRADLLAGAQLWNAGAQAQWTPIQNANGVFGNYTGFGNSTTSGQQGGGWQGALGGALTGAATGRQMGWW